MTYRLDPAVGMNESLRGVALGELDIAHAALASNLDRHDGVHSARKCLKRLRSLLLLIRPGLPEPIFAGLNDRLRNVFKGLAAARDAHALLDALEKLSDGIDETPPIQSLRGWLRKRRDAAERLLEGTAATEAIRGLAILRPGFAALTIYPDDFSSTGKGLRLCYRATRKAFDRAMADGGDDDFHDWRKGVQHHWRQMQLLAACHPAELSARVEAARTLSQLLGDDHDIAMLRRLVATPTMTFGTPEDTEEFLTRCLSRQKAIRREAQARGEALFAERARPFSERVEGYWRSAAQSQPQIGPATFPVEESKPREPRADNVVSFETARNRSVS